MSIWKKIAVGAAGVAVLTTLGLGIRRVVQDRRMAGIERALRADKSKDVFSEALVDDLPAPAQRYFRHAIQPGTHLAQSVRLQISGRMKPQEGADLIDFTAEETLAPPRGFVWTAHLWMGPLPVRVRDHYAPHGSEVTVHALGLIPVGGAAGPEVTRSSGGRLAGESIWLPSALLPGAGATWEPIDETHACVTLSIGEEAVPLTLHIDESGRLRELTMMRYGDVGVETWQPLPYGFAVTDEQTVGGYTIPSALRGGWWYGTDRYDPDGATHLRVREASFD